jgi:hypothetical protein
MFIAAYSWHRRKAIKSTCNWASEALMLDENNLAYNVTDVTVCTVGYES